MEKKEEVKKYAVSLLYRGVGKIANSLKIVNAVNERVAFSLAYDDCNKDDQYKDFDLASKVVIEIENNFDEVKK